VVVAGETFHLEPALDDVARTRGLMGRTEIPAGGGMLFVFPDARMQSFWMKECVVDMDIIFLDARGTVTAVHRMTIEPPRRDDETEREYERRLRRYTSVVPAQFVIELRAGTADRLGVRVDDRVPLDLPRLKAMAR
jgi:uncharacterized membrane protein (UPF0127 family)